MWQPDHFACSSPTTPTPRGMLVQIAGTVPTSTLVRSVRSTESHEPVHEQPGTDREPVRGLPWETAEKGAENTWSPTTI
jgi:hypothetical protein